MGLTIKYELQEIERLITDGQARQADDKFWQVTRNVLHLEIERIKRKFVDEVFSFEDERHLERYIQYHQQAIIHLMDDINESPSSHRKNFRAIFYNSLQELLKFIERHFSKYFDQNAKAPFAYVTHTMKQGRRYEAGLRKELHKRNADPVMVDSLLSVLDRFPKRPQVITYRQIMYINLMLQELHLLIKSPNTDQQINDQLRSLAFYLNYNHETFIDYLYQYFKSMIEGQETRLERIEKLAFELKVINQSTQKPGVSFDETMPSLKFLLSDYINEEIVFQSRVNNSQTANKTTEGFISAFKVKFDTSVSQLAYIIKIFVESNVIQHPNLTELLRFVSTVIVTKRSESVSFDSLRSKYYNTEHGTREAVKSLLVAMVQHIEKNKYLS